MNRNDNPIVSDGGWPDIVGIESDAVREQIGGDARLFLMLLGKLVDDFADVRGMAAEVDAATLHVLGSRMHKLKGAAGTLGAVLIAELGGQAERAAAAGDIAAFGRLATAAAAALETLRGNLAGAQIAVACEVPGRPAARLQGDRMGADPAMLIHLLRRQDLAALARFEAMEQALRTDLGEEAFGTLRDYIDHLRFDAAAALLEARTVPM